MIVKENIAEKFDNLFSIIQTDKFLKMEALGGEIPFYISNYHPEQTLVTQKAIKGLINKLENKGLIILDLNVYDICMEILEEQLGEGEIFELEKDMDKEEFKNALQSVLDIQEVVMPFIQNRIKSSKANVYFMTGVGSVFPFIRSHNILNNLQNVAKDAPTVMFFPGQFNGQSLELFGKLTDDNYYRAFNLNNYKL